MKRFLGKIILYAVLAFACLELYVRVLHLQSEYPTFIINKANVKTYAPNQEGYYVTGNRRMNFAQYQINNAGYNSYREFTPTKDKIEIALIGDSFIEGLHQNYYNSIGKKLEAKLGDSINVFEYGHSGYDFADQLNLITAYSEEFKLIDYVIFYMKFENDLRRDFYEPDQYWIDSQFFLTSRIEKHIKLFKYLADIGVMGHFRDLKSDLLYFAQNLRFQGPRKKLSQTPEKKLERAKQYLSNFKTLVDIYGFDKNKTAILLDTNFTSKLFLDYCDEMGYKYIDFGQALESSQKPTTLIYDLHWNNRGRNLIANAIANYLKTTGVLRRAEDDI